ncbi:unnamed protein product, partial [Ascophyllum nodosum]
NPSDSGVSADLCPAKRAPSFQFHRSGAAPRRSPLKHLGSPPKTPVFMARKKPQ